MLACGPWALNEMLHCAHTPHQTHSIRGNAGNVSSQARTSNFMIASQHRR
jgi:hypothetical protein